jgi:hypothetical protein
MAFLGHWRYGNAEVINHERLATYVANGITAAGADITVEDVCEGLGAALDNTGPYRTPLLDQAPWVDDDNPDTYDFAGVMALEITGADGSTRTVEMQPTLGDGALPGRARRGPRTIGVTAMLVGSTSEGIDAGLSWLQRVLAGDCAGLDATCGPSATLEMLTVCPGPIIPTVDTNSPATTTVYDGDPLNPDDQWQPYGGSFDTSIPGYGTELTPYDAVDTIDAGDADDPDDTDPVDGGPSGGGGDYFDGGASTIEGSATIAVGPFQACNDGPITVTWTLSTPETGIDANVQLVMVDEAGQPVLYGPKFLVTDASDTYEWEVPFGVDYDGWRPAVTTDDRLVVLSVSVTAYGFLALIDCVNPYRRLLPRTVTVSGPTVVDTIDAGCVLLHRVEWVWVVGSPYRYTPPDPVLVALSQASDPALVAPGVTWGDGGTVAATPWNCALPAPETPCAIDPCAPGFGTPPALPVIAGTAATITTQNVKDLWVCVGPEQVPANDGVFTISLTPTTPIVGARVRVYDTALGDCSVPDLCDFAYEYLIDYVPDDGVFTINGLTEEFTTLCDGGAVLADASPVVRGSYGGPTAVPVARCDRRYLIRVQWLALYPRTCVGLYTTGQPQGDLSVSVSVSTREG